MYNNKLWPPFGKEFKFLNNMICAIISGELSIQNLNPNWEGQ